MKRLLVILFLFAALVPLQGGCTYYYPLYNASDYPDYPENYGFIGPFFYYSPYGEYSYYEYPYPYSYPYEYYNYPATRVYLGEKPGAITERQFERNSSEKESGPSSR